MKETGEGKTYVEEAGEGKKHVEETGEGKSMWKRWVKEIAHERDR